MKILFHCDEFMPSNAPCAKRMGVIASHLAKEGHKITVLTSSLNKKYGEYKPPEGVRVKYAPSIPMVKKNTVFRLLNNLSFAATSFFASLTAGKADVIVTTSPPLLLSISGYLISKVKKCKLIFDIRDIWPDVACEIGELSEKSFIYRAFKKIADFMYRKSDAITTVSPGKVEKLKEKLGEKYADKIKYVGNGLDGEFVLHSIDENVKEKYGFDHRFTCVYAGNIGKAYNFDHVLNIADEVRDMPVRFMFFGNGAAKNELIEKARKMELSNITFQDPVPQHEVFTLLSSADLSIIPLRSGEMLDTVPIKLYEVLASGCPVLLGAKGDAKNILDHSGLGISVDPEDEDGFKKAFFEIYEKNYTKAHREFAKTLMLKKYSRQKFADVMHDTVNELAG